MEDFFAPLPSLFSDEFNTPGKRHSVPVNISETPEAYALEVVAPGFSKEDFKINLENNMLTIEGVKKMEKKDEKNLRVEYRYDSFKRSFTVDKNIEASQISAQYVNGVLRLNLPKKAEVKASAKQIEIQ
jgi:HSP20 family protein